MANHPAALQTRLPATYAFSPGQALVVEGKVGKGRFVALANPSVLINNMAELPDNQAFARALLAELCVPGPDGDRVHVLTGPFEARSPARLDVSGEGSLRRANELFATLNQSVEELVASLGPLLSAVLCLAGAALAWTALSRRRGSRHHDGHFVRADGAFERSAHVLISGLPRDGSGNHALALSMLRAEVMRRLGAHLGPIPAGAPRRCCSRASRRCSGPVRAPRSASSSRSVRRTTACSPIARCPAPS